MMIESIAYFCLFLIGLRMVYDDFISRTVRVFDVIAFCMLLIFLTQPDLNEMLIALCIASSIILIQCILKIIWKKTWLATADIILLSLTPLILPLLHFPAFFITIGALLILFHFLTGDEKAPFVTVYLLSLSSMQLILFA